MMEKEYYFLRDTWGYLMDEVTSAEADECIARGYFVEAISAGSREEAHELAEKWNCEHGHWYAGNPCTCGNHDF